MAFSTFMIVILLGILTNLFLEKAGLKGINSLAGLVHTNIPKEAIRDSTFIKKIDLSNADIENIDFTDSLNTGMKNRNFLESRFTNCVFNLNDLAGNSKFKDSKINSSNIVVDPPKNSLVTINNLTDIFIPLLSLSRSFIIYERLVSSNLLINRFPKNYSKLLLLDEIIEAENKLKSLKNYVVVSRQLPVNFPWKSNNFISSKDYYLSSNDINRSSNLIIFLNTKIQNPNYQFDPKQEIIFLNCNFDKDFKSREYLEKNKNVIISDSVNKDNHISIDSVMHYLSKDILKVDDKGGIYSQLKKMDLVTIENLAELNILEYEPELNWKIDLYLKKAGNAEKNTKDYKRFLFLKILWQITLSAPKKEMDKSLNDWVNWCKVTKSLDKKAFDTWEWDTWNTFSRRILNLTTKQIAFINALSKSETDKFHEIEVNEDVLNQDLKHLKYAYKKLYN
jgi:hypothetical protein